MLRFFLWFLLSFTAQAEEIQFKLKGQPATHPKLDLAQLQKTIPPVTLTVWDDHLLRSNDPESAKITYKAIPFRKVLDLAYGPSWKSVEEILFTCKDGYQPSVPVERFLAHDPYLAYEIPGKEFAISNLPQNISHIDLSPFYLVWDNFKDPDFRAEGLAEWPYQLVAVDLISFVDKFPKLAPPPKSSAKVRDGFLVFRRNCLQCHSINGEGSQKGIELNYPANVTEYFKEPWLVKWILDPASLRYNTTMPAFRRTDKDREGKAKAIVTYLKAMVKAKQAP